MTSQKIILIVEDNEINRAMLRGILESEYKVLEAPNGLEALKVLNDQKDNVSLILLDIVMPVMDGYEATAAIRALPRQDAVRIPILALTANAFVTDVGKAKNAGMNDHITKPINLEVLFATLYKWLV